MSGRKQFEEYESEGQINKFVSKSRDSPFVPIGKRLSDIVTSVIWFKVQSEKRFFVSISSNKCECGARAVTNFVRIWDFFMCPISFECDDQVLFHWLTSLICIVYSVLLDWHRVSFMNRVNYMCQCDYCIIFKYVAMYWSNNECVVATSIPRYTCHLNLWFFIDAQMRCSQREISLFNFHDQGHRFRTWLTFNAFSFLIHSIRPRKRQWVGTFLLALFLKQSQYISNEMSLNAWTWYILIDFFFSCVLFRSGMAGFFAVAGYGLYNFRKRNVSASVYLMQLRVAAQGTVVGTLCIGLMYSMYNQYYLKKQPAVSDTNQSHQH